MFSSLSDGKTISSILDFESPNSQNPSGGALVCIGEVTFSLFSISSCSVIKSGLGVGSADETDIHLSNHSQPELGLEESHLMWIGFLFGVDSISFNSKQKVSIFG
jgi:hypothetical protein